MESSAPGLIEAWQGSSTVSMCTSMSCRLGLAVLLGLFLTGCSAWHSGWPRWAKKLESTAECGMSIATVEDLTRHEVTPNELIPDRGTHRISGRVTNAWLTFSEEGLEAVALSKVHGLFQIHQSPRRNLCTGELTFFLELQWVDSFQGSKVYLDGELVAENARSGLIVEVPLGSHTLRIETLTAGVGVKQVVFQRNDSGNRLVVLTHEDFQDAERG